VERAERKRRAVIRTQAKAYAVVILLAACPSAFGLNPSLDINQYAHTSWLIRDGFTKGAIISIAQTPDGYLWLGTEFGVVRFDGVRAVPWNPSGLRQGVKLVATLDGTLWIDTYPGVASWKDGKLTQYPKLDHVLFSSLIADREGKVWLGSSYPPPGRLCSIQKGEVQCYGEGGELGDYVACLLQDSEGALWVGTSNGVVRWMPDSPKIHPLPAQPNGYAGLGVDGNGALLISTPKGIQRLVDGKLAMAYPSPPRLQPFTAQQLLRDRDGGLWMATGRGLAHFHNGRADLFTQADGLSGDHSSAIFEDREGNIWVATSNGLDRFRDVDIPCYSVAQGISNGFITSVLAARDGSVWIGTDDGLNRWDHGQVTIYRERHGSVRDGVQEIVGRGLPDRGVHSLFQDDLGRIWISDRRAVGFLEKDRFVPVEGVPGGIVQSIVEDKAGDLWIATLGALSHVSSAKLLEQMPWSRVSPGKFGRPLVADRLNGGLWVGFFPDGVAHFDYGRIQASYEVAQGLGRGRVYRLRVDRDETLWASTDGGLSRVKDGRVVTLNSRNGLPCDSVQWSIEDEAGSLWLAMPCGLVRVALSEVYAWAAGKKTSVNTAVFDHSDGVRLTVAPSSYNPQADRSPDGRIWFATKDGVGLIDPRWIRSNAVPPPVHIEQVKADGKTYDASRGLRLPPLVRDVSISYTALCLTAPEKVRFRYKLEGQDSSWKEVINDRQAQYTNLAPRNYRFHLMACNDSGVWNEAGDSLDFSIDPAYFQTAWFRVSCVAAFFASLWALYWYRLHQIAHQFNARLEERVNERTRIARELHDTLLQSFHGLLMRFQAVQNLLPGRVADARAVLQAAVDDAAQAITEARDAVHDLRSSAVTENDLAKAIEAVGQELAVHEKDANGAAPAFSLEVEGTPQDLHPILRDEIYRIASEALRNVFHHARARRIEVEIRYDARLLRVRVRDDGIGFDTNVLQEGRAGHYGLPGMRERAKSIGGQLEIWSERGAGTELELSVPASVAYRSQASRSFRLFKSKAGTNS